MPKAKLPVASTPPAAADKPPVSQFLPDGHPNAAFYPKDGEGFEQFQAALDEQNLWGDYFGKLYRCAPKRNPNDKNVRVCKFANTLLMEEIEKKYGGKKWSAYMTRRVGKREQLLGIFQFDIEAKPIYQDDEGDEPGTQAAATPSKANSEAMQLIGTFVEDIRQQRDLAQEKGEDFDYESAFTKSVELLSRASNSSIDLLMEQSRKVNAGGNGFETFTGLLTALSPIILELIKNSRREDPLTAKLLERAFAPPPDALAQLDKVLSIAEKINGNGGTRAATGWAGIAEKALDKVPDLLIQGKQLIDSAAAARAAQVRPAPAMLTPAPAPVPDSLHTNANPAMMPGNGPDPVVIDHLKRMLVKMIGEGDSGEVGAQTADLIAPEYAQELRETLQQNPMALASDPILSQSAASPHLRQFIADFLQWFDEADRATPPNPEPPQPMASAGAP